MQRLPQRKRALRRNNSLLLLFVLVLVFITFDMALASQDVIYKKTRPLKKVFDTERTVSEEKEEEKGYIYDPAGKTDPFKSFIAIREEKEEKKKKKPKTYLETLELSQLELMVIVVSSRGRWAMVRDSKGAGHVIRKVRPWGETVERSTRSVEAPS